MNGLRKNLGSAVAISLSLVATLTLSSCDAASNVATAAGDGAKTAASSAAASAASSVEAQAKDAIQKQIDQLSATFKSMTPDQVKAQVEQLAQSVPELSGMAPEKLQELATSACKAKQEGEDSIVAAQEKLNQILGKPVDAEKARKVSSELISQYCN